MEQPFLPFNPFFLKRLLAMKKSYLVTQTNTRQLPATPGEKNGKISLLLSDYSDYAMAKTHWDALKTDPWRAVIDMNNPVHQEKLHRMMEEDSDYQLFWAVVDNMEKLQTHINKKYSAHLKRYIEQKTSWRIGSAHSLRPSLQLIFGELFIVLKFSGQTLRVKFTEIESS